MEVLKFVHDRLPKPEQGWLCSILLVGAVLRLYGLNAQSLWYDEGLQYYVAANRTIFEILGQMSSFHPPLSFVISHLFLQIHESDLFLRLPSALFGIASLPVFYILARELTSTRIALVSAFVMAISPFHVWYSQDGRMYSQLLFFSLLSSVLLIQAVRKQRVNGWVCYVVISVLGMYTHVFMLLILLAQFVWVILHNRGYIAAHTVCGVMIFVMFSPWILFLPWVQHFFLNVSRHALGAAESVPVNTSFRPGFSWEGIPYTLFTYSVGFSAGPTIGELHENRSVAFLMQFAPIILFVGVIFGIFLFAGLIALYKYHGKSSTTFCLLGFSIPILGTLLYALAPKAHYNVRYTIVAFPYFCLLCGAGVAFALSRYRAVGAGLSVCLVAVSLTSVANYFFSPRYAKEDIRSAVAFWRSDASSEPLFSYQSHHVLSVYLRESERERHFSLSGDVVSDLNRFFSKAQAPTVYLLLARDWKQLKENALKQSYLVDFEKSYPGVKILKITRTQKPATAIGAL